jgi:hypothetical protein
MGERILQIDKQKTFTHVRFNTLSHIQSNLWIIVV